jgi:methionine sulfoxide reductase heme-binding subunit
LTTSVGPSAYWYLTRSTGVVALVLLTVTVAIGVLDVARVGGPTWPRFVIDGVHRTVSLLAVALLGIHILTAVLDSFAPISLINAVVPFTGQYRPIWLGLGALASDLLLAVAVTSLARRRLGHSAWRATHWLAYACWPIAVIHGFGTGSDVAKVWLEAINLGCVVVVLAAVVARASIGWPGELRVRVAALGAAAVFAAGLAIWLPGGPLGAHWARRAGTPPSLLGPSTSTGQGAASQVSANATGAGGAGAGAAADSGGAGSGGTVSGAAADSGGTGSRAAASGVSAGSARA